MSALTDWAKAELYPTLFNSGYDQALPELQLERRGQRWISPLNRDGSKPKNHRQDKTIITHKSPGYIFENGERGAISLIDYVIERDGASVIEALHKLAQAAGLEVPRADEQSATSYRQQQKRQSILETAQAYFKHSLQAETGEAQQVRDYLSKRGYSNEEALAMELGLIPSQDALYGYLASHGYQYEEAREALTLSALIGKSHKLTIPYRSEGALRGFVIRATQSGATPKYINSTGLKKDEALFNLNAVDQYKDLVLVEGYLDALHAEAKGIKNVAALGAAKISKPAIEQALRRGAKTFTLCFDGDEAGQEGIEHAISHLLEYNVYKVYVVDLTTADGTKADPDSVIQQDGIEALKAAIASAQPYYLYQLQRLLTRYGKLQDEQNGTLTAKQSDRLIDELVLQSARIPDPIQRDQYAKELYELEAIKELGITQQTLDEAQRQINEQQAKHEQTQATSQTLQQASRLLKDGKTDEVLELLNQKLPELRRIENAKSYADLYTPDSIDADRERYHKAKEGLATGLTIQETKLTLAPKSLAVFAAPTGHGKTTTLINIALNILTQDANTKIAFLTYEEPPEKIRSYFINAYLDQALNNQKDSNRKLIQDFLSKGDLTYVKESQQKALVDAVNTFYNVYIHSGRLLVKPVYDLKIDELVLAIQAINKNVEGLAGLFIDYFQLIHADGKLKKEYNVNTRQEELKQICLILRKTADQEGLPIALAAQFNRDVKEVADIHETSIREAADIEQIAETIVGVYDINKNPKEPTKASKALLNNVGNEGLFMKILKSRHLPSGKYDTLDYDSNTNKIKSPDL
jgi:DNA primase catalytic core